MFKLKFDKIKESVTTCIDKVRTDLADAIRPPVTPEQQKAKSSKLFEEQWQRTKEALCEGRDLTTNKDGSHNPNKKKTFEVVLENTRRELMRHMEAANGGSAGSANIATLNKVILPVIRRVIPNLLANDILCVQPMEGPVSRGKILRAKMLADTNRPSFRLIEDVMEARTRKLAARWTFEAASDAKVHLGVDIEAEIMAALAQEVTAEHDCEIITYLKSAVGKPTMTFDLHNELHPEETFPFFVGDIYDKFVRMIDAEASAVGERNKRGPANWCIVGAKSLTALKSSTYSSSSFRRTSEKQSGGVQFVGTLNESINVYCDPYSRDNDPVLVGYKGSDIDGPAIFAPYVPLTSSGVIIDPTTFEPVVSFMTRYGFMVMEKGDYISETKDYLGLVGFTPEKAL